jgi:hypothetical protein
VLFHHGDMNGIAGGEVVAAQNDALRPLHRGAVDRQDVVNHRQKDIEGRLYGVAAIDGDVPMEDLLQDLGIRDEALAGSHQGFQRRRRVAIAGQPMTLVSPEDLILSKLMWAKAAESAEAAGPPTAR